MYIYIRFDFLGVWSEWVVFYQFGPKAGIAPVIQTVTLYTFNKIKYIFKVVSTLWKCWGFNVSQDSYNEITWSLTQPIFQPFQGKSDGQLAINIQQQTFVLKYDQTFGNCCWYVIPIVICRHLSNVDPTLNIQPHLLAYIWYKIQRWASNPIC